jgi:hypothetical protein
MALGEAAFFSTLLTPGADRVGVGLTRVGFFLGRTTISSSGRPQGPYTCLPASQAGSPDRMTPYPYHPRPYANQPLRLSPKKPICASRVGVGSAAAVGSSTGSWSGRP